MSRLSGPEIAPASGKVKHLLIFLHGLGADGNDLISLAGEFAEVLPDTQFLSPNAPYKCDMAPYGYQWFSLLDRDMARIEREIRIASEPLNAFIDAQMKRFNLQDKDVAMLGFSQGSMMSMFTALRREKPLAGVVAMSGVLRGELSLPNELKSRPPICLVHGQLDEVVPFSALPYSEQVLRAHQVPVESHARPQLGHGIDLEGIEIAKTFLTKSFGL